MSVSNEFWISLGYFVSTGLSFSLIYILFRRERKILGRISEVELKNHILCESLGLDLSKIDPETELIRQLRVYISEGKVDQAKKLFKDNVTDLSQLRRVTKGMRDISKVVD